MATRSLELRRGRILTNSKLLPQQLAVRKLHHAETELNHRSRKNYSPHRHTQSLSSSVSRGIIGPKAVSYHDNTGTRSLSPVKVPATFAYLSEKTLNIWQRKKLDLSNRQYSKIVDSLNLDLPNKIKTYVFDLSYIRKKAAGKENKNDTLKEIEDESLQIEPVVENTIPNADTIKEVIVESKPRIPYHIIYDQANYAREQHEFEEAMLKNYDSVQTYYSQIKLPKNHIVYSSTSSSDNASKQSEKDSMSEDSTVDSSGSHGVSDEFTQAINDLAKDFESQGEPVKSSSTTRKMIQTAGDTISGTTKYISGVAQRLPTLPNVSQHLPNLPNLTGILPQRKESADAVKEKDAKSIAKKEFAKRKQVKKPKIPQVFLEKKTQDLCRGLKNATAHSSRFIRLCDLSQHVFEYPDTRGIALEENVIPIILQMRESRDMQTKAQANQALTLIGYVNPPKGRGVRILSLDGGGTRGLYSLALMRRLELATGKRIHEMFDHISGVSTGSLLAALIAVNNVPIEHTEGLYKEFGKELFSQSRISGIKNLFRSHAFYDSAVWEKLLNLNVGDSTFLDSMKAADNPRLACISTIMNASSLQSFVFRNYEYPPGMSSRYQGSMKYALWESIRASSAAPGYYSEYKLHDYMHIDGGFRCNNPTAIAIHECKTLWPNEDIQCVVSLGTGRYQPPGTLPTTISSPQEKIIKLIKSATDTEALHQTLHDMLPPETYFRFNPYMSEDFLLDETRSEKWEQMAIDTEMYCQKNERKFESCASQLLLERTPVQKAKDYFNLQRAKHPLKLTKAPASTKV